VRKPARAVVREINILAPGGAYNGAAILVDNYSHVTAYPVGSSGDVAPLAVTPDMTYPGGIARDASGRIYVSNRSTNTITVYAANASGNVPPVAVIGGAKTRLVNPTGIALDASGKIYVLNTGTSAITVYPPLGTGTGFDLTPTAIIAGAKTRLATPVALAVDGSGDICVANESTRPLVSVEHFKLGAITVYAAGSNGNVAPSTIISGAATGLILPASIALDSDRDIYVASFYSDVGGTIVSQPKISIFPSGSEGDAQPSAVITNGNAAINYFDEIALDSARNIYAGGFTNEGQAMVDVFPAGSIGDASPTAQISGADTGLTGFVGLALDSDDNLYVLGDGGGPTHTGGITVYPPGSTGDVVPINTITSNFSGISSSSGIAMDSKGTIYVANATGGANFPNGTLAIFRPGSYATTAPASVVGGDNTGLDFPRGVALDARGNISVLNSNDVVTVYPAGSAGNVTPSATISLTGNINPTGIARGTGGELYVASQGTIECNNNGNCRQTGVDAIDIYSPRANGNVKPAAVISGYLTGLASPGAIAVSQRGNILVANQGPMNCSSPCECFPNGNGSITAYAPGSAANAEPIATIQGPQTRLQTPSAIAVDANENIYVVDSGAIVNGVFGGRVGVGCSFPQSIAEQATTHRVAGSSSATGELRRNGKASGDIDILDIAEFGFYEVAAVSSVLFFKAGSNGNVPPIAIFAVPSLR